MKSSDRTRWCAVRDVDLPAFQRVMTQLGAVCSKKPEDGAVPTYFRLLQRYELSDVARGADAWAQNHKFFPQIAEWAEAIRSVPKGEPLLEMPRDEAAEWLNAERLKWEADSCSCRECLEAGATSLPIRFVPTLDRFEEYTKRLIGSREVLRGHWAHGYELVRWHVAREECMVIWRAVGKGPLRKVLDSITEEVTR